MYVSASESGDYTEESDLGEQDQPGAHLKIASFRLLTIGPLERACVRYEDSIIVGTSSYTF